MRLLPYDAHDELGRAIGRVIQESEKRIAFIASVEGVTRTTRTAFVVSTPPQPSTTPGCRKSSAQQIPMFYYPPTAQLLSYEVDVYFGILCAEFRPW